MEVVISVLMIAAIEAMIAVSQNHYLSGIRIFIVNIKNTRLTLLTVRIRGFSGLYFPAFGLNTERYG